MKKQEGIKERKARNSKETGAFLVGRELKCKRQLTGGLKTLPIYVYEKIDRERTKEKKKK